MSPARANRRSPTLSVCCLCDHDGARVAAALAPLRTVAHEIAVAVDDRVPVTEQATLAAAADRLVRVEGIGWAAQAWSWLHGLCRGDWILRLDGDELCSPALLAALPGLLERRDVRQYAIHRRWLWPDEGSWLQAWPWAPDRPRRRYRNDAALHFSGRPGTGAEPCFPSGDVEAPIYSLGAVDRPERHGPGRRARLRLPWRRSSSAPRTAELESEDREAIRAVLAARPAGAPPAAPAPLVPAGVVLRHWAGRVLGEGAYRARVVPRSGPRVLRAAEQRPFHVTVVNEGDQPWPGGEGREPLIRPSYHWLDAEGATVVFDGLRTALPAPLAPGGACRMPVSVLAPPVVGDFELRFDLVHEGHRWFDAPAASVPVTVVAG